MSRSATSTISRVDRRRQQTKLRLTDEAIRLTIERGFDHFTVDELAEAVGISRRTFFNYFASKEDVLLGDQREDAHPEVTQRFVAGLPTGDLLDDMVAAIATMLEPESPSPQRIRLFHQAVESEPKLAKMFHARYLDRADRLAELVAEREGIDADSPRARVAVDLIGALITRAFTTFATFASGDADPTDTGSTDLGPSLLDLLRQNLAVARDLLARTAPA